MVVLAQAAAMADTAQAVMALLLEQRAVLLMLCLYDILSLILYEDCYKFWEEMQAAEAEVALVHPLVQSQVVEAVLAGQAPAIYGLRRQRLLARGQLLLVVLARKVAAAAMVAMHREPHLEEAAAAAAAAADT